MTKYITATGNYRFPVHPGQTFHLAAVGAFNGSTVKAQYLADLNGVVTAYDFATTAISLTANGEKTGVNHGSYNEININVSVANPTGIAVIVTPSRSNADNLSA